MDNFNHEILEHNTSKQSNKQNTQKTTKEKGTGGGGVVVVVVARESCCDLYIRPILQEYHRYHYQQVLSLNA